MPVVSNIAYLGMYPDATMGALAIGAIIELIPLGGILLAFAIMEKSVSGNRVLPPVNAAPRITASRTPKRRGRPPKA